MKTLSIILAACVFAVPAFAQTPLMSNTPNYQAASGTHYQYDLSRPADALRYGVDLRAQTLDSINVNPGVDLDRSMGQHGGGTHR